MASDFISKLEDAFTHLAPLFGAKRLRLNDVINQETLESEQSNYELFLEKRKEGSDRYRDCEIYNVGTQTGFHLLSYFNENKFREHSMPNFMTGMLRNTGGEYAGWVYDSHKCSTSHPPPGELSRVKKGIITCLNMAEDKSNDFPEKVALFTLSSGLLPPMLGYLLYKYRGESQLGNYAQMSAKEAVKFLRDLPDINIQKN